MSVYPILEILLYVLGKWGPLWLGLYAFYIFQNNGNMLWMFSMGLLFNAVLNHILKVTIKEERPLKWVDDETHTFYYGMPSGHAQQSVFMATFLYLQGNVPYMHYVWFLCGIVMFERVYTQQHSLKQVLVGAIIGGALAYIYRV